MFNCRFLILSVVFLLSTFVQASPPNLYEGFGLEPLVREQQQGPTEGEEEKEEHIVRDYENAPIWGFMEGSIETGFVHSTGNSETSTVLIKADLRSDYETFRSQFAFNTLITRDREKQDSDKTTAERYFASGQVNYKMGVSNESRYVYGAYEKDRFAGYNSRMTVSAGWSTRYYETNEAFFDFEIGPGYKRDKAQDTGKVTSIAIARFNAVYERRLTDFSNFKQVISSDIAVTANDNTYSFAESSLVTRVFGSLAMKLALTFKHNSQPEDDKTTLDKELTVTLVYAF